MHEHPISPCMNAHAIYAGEPKYSMNKPQSVCASAPRYSPQVLHWAGFGSWGCSDASAVMPLGTACAQPAVKLVKKPQMLQAQQKNPQDLISDILKKEQYL